MMKVLVTGASGQLGNELKHCLETMTAEIGPIPNDYRNADVDYVDYDELDITQARAVTSWFSDNGPYDIVINCAAMTNVDACETREAEAFKVNAIGCMHLAIACNACNATFVHISTDYVFSGDHPGLRCENDRALPISAYGRTKWAGELLAIEACPKTFVIRTAWLYGYKGKNFPKTMLRLAREQGTISVVSDQIGNPTSANDLAYEILKIALTDSYGIYHCTNNGECSWYEFACAVVDAAGIQCNKEELTSKEYKERFPASARRPAFSALDNAHLRQTIGDEMRPWREALDNYVANLEKQGD